MKKLILGSVLILAAGTVLAGNEKLSALDTNKDGLLSIEEAKVDPTLNNTFSELDVNQDGYLSESELTVTMD